MGEVLHLARLKHGSDAFGQHGRRFDGPAQHLPGPTRWTTSQNETIVNPRKDKLLFIDHWLQAIMNLIISTCKPMFSMGVLYWSYRPYTGLAAARTEHRAFSRAWMPALAMVTWRNKKIDWISSNIKWYGTGRKNRSVKVNLFLLEWK